MFLCCEHLIGSISPTSDAVWILPHLLFAECPEFCSFVSQLRSDTSGLWCRQLLRKAPLLGWAGGHLCEHLDFITQAMKELGLKNSYKHALFGPETWSDLWKQVTKSFAGPEARQWRRIVWPCGRHSTTKHRTLSTNARHCDTFPQLGPANRLILSGKKRQRSEQSGPKVIFPSTSAILITSSLRHQWAGPAWGH